jgi:hypothetical protein
MSLRHRSSLTDNNSFIIRYPVALILIIIITGCEESTVPNNDPQVNTIAAFPDPVKAADSFAVFISAVDPDEDPLTYDWFCTNGHATIKGAPRDSQFERVNTKENIMIFYVPDSLNPNGGHAAIFCDVRDNRGGLKTSWIIVEITK